MLYPRSVLNLINQLLWLILSFIVMAQLAILLMVVTGLDFPLLSFMPIPQQ
nr:MAG TPA: hypothetical protein [Caudoviricetes sp.]